MTDNIKHAIAAVHAELKHARQGLAHYEHQVNSLHRALTQLDSMGGGAQAAPAKGKRGRKPKAVAAEDAKQSQVRKGKSGLPFTGGDFWESLITATPQAAKDVLAAAIKKAGIKPNADQIKKLTSRMVFALNALVKVGTIKDSGRGRDRRFFV